MQVDVSGQRFVFPEMCACCGAPGDNSLAVSASKSTGKRVVHTKSYQWHIPYCTRCLIHISTSETAGTVVAVLIVISLVGGLWLAYGVEAYLGAAFGVVALVATLILGSKLNAKARAQCGSTCISVGRAFAYLGWHGTLHQFDITSQHYARDFMLVNQRKLVNLSPEAKNLLASSGVSPQTSRQRYPDRYVS